MYKVYINSNVKIYFFISWVVGIVLLFPVVSGWSENAAYLLLFASFMNVLFNGLVIIFLLVLLYVFPENRIQFFHSVILLLVNFPSVMVYYLIFLLTTNNL